MTFHFPPTLVIALRDSSRRVKFELECGHYLDDAVFIDAVDTRDLHNTHIGCALSHRRAIQYAQARGWSEVLVLEDDAVFLPQRAAALQPLSHLPVDAEIVYLGGYRGIQYTAAPTGVPGLLRVHGGLTTTHALLYRERVYASVLEYIPSTVDEALRRWGPGEQSDFPQAIDQEYERWQRDPSRRIFALEERPFVGNFTEIEPMLGSDRIRIRRAHAPMPVLALCSRRHCFLNALVAKNASTSIKRVVAVSDPEVGVKAVKIGVDHAVGYSANGRWLLQPGECMHPRLDHYLKFLVYRDPVERLRSLYTWRASGAPRQRWADMIRDGMLAPPQLDDHFESLIRAELSFRVPSLIDEHVRPQRMTFDNVPIDLVVPIERLGRFFEQQFGIPLPRANRSASAAPRHMEPTFQRLAEDLYRGDYEILTSGVEIWGGSRVAPAGRRGDESTISEG